MSNKKIILTQEGYDKLQEEYKELINVKRPANIQAIKEARSLGDLSENAEYDAARNEQAELESRIKYLEKILDNGNYEIIKDKPTDKVGIGSTVKIKYVDEEDEEEYTIVGSQEADPLLSKISNESPVAKALLEHKIGETVEVETPNGSTYQIEILAIS
jgi:transcription elongation factor greA